MVGYAFYGHLSLRYITLMYPLALVLLFLRNEAKNMMRIVIVVLLILAFAQTGFYVLDNYNKPNTIATDSSSASSWLIDHGGSSRKILADFQTSQEILLAFSASDQKFSQAYFDSDIYSSLVNGVNLQGKVSFIVMNFELVQLIGTGWDRYEPFEENIDRISENTMLDRIYDDSKMVTLANIGPQ
jgi:hypothetical protein